MKFTGESSEILFLDNYWHRSPAIIIAVWRLDCLFRQVVVHVCFNRRVLPVCFDRPTFVCFDRSLSFCFDNLFFVQIDRHNEGFEQLNVLVSSSGEPILADFGLSRMK